MNSKIAISAVGARRTPVSRRIAAGTIREGRLLGDNYTRAWTTITLVHRAGALRACSLTTTTLVPSSPGSRSTARSTGTRSCSAKPRM